MKEFQRKRKIRKFLYSRASILILLALVALISKATFSVYQKEQESRKNLHRVEQELAALQAREVALEQKITRLKTPEGKEAAIREQFQVAKPGERMVVIVEDDSSKRKDESVERSLVSRFFDIFR